MSQSEIRDNIALIEDVLKMVGIADDTLGGLLQRATDTYKAALEAEAKRLRGLLG